MILLGSSDVGGYQASANAPVTCDEDSHVVGDISGDMPPVWQLKLAIS
jgi:hypothetical protein